MKKQHGYSLAETVVAVAVLGLMLAVTVPALATLRRKDALRVASHEIRALFYLARSRAVARSCNVALKFRKQQGVWTYAMYEDGDGDGVRNDDITAGRDPLIRSATVLGSERNPVTIGLPSFKITDPDTGANLPPTASPVQFNISTLCSFTPNGTATPGSIFLTNRYDDAVVLRVYAPTAKIRALRFDRVAKRWRR